MRIPAVKILGSICGALLLTTIGGLTQVHALSPNAPYGGTESYPYVAGVDGTRQTVTAWQVGPCGTTQPMWNCLSGTGSPLPGAVSMPMPGYTTAYVMPSYSMPHYSVAPA